MISFEPSEHHFYDFSSDTEKMESTVFFINLWLRRKTLGWDFLEDFLWIIKQIIENGKEHLRDKTGYGSKLLKMFVFEINLDRR